jgi:hypothetical protein
MREEAAMNVIDLLRENSNEIVGEATTAIRRAHLPHYELADPSEARRRMKTLCDLILECLQTNSTAPMSRYAQQIAGERFFSGYTLREVQTAFNLLEESIWSQILDKMQIDEFAAAVTTVNAPIRAGKDEVAQTYFSLLSKSKASPSDLKMHFKGFEHS